MKALLIIFYLLVVCEGSIRKWILFGNYSAIMFGLKFIPLFLIFSKYSVESSKYIPSAYENKYKNGIYFLLLIFIFSFPYSMCQYSWIVPTLAFITLTLPYILAFTLPRVITKTKEIDFIVRSLCWLMLIADVVAIIQSLKPATSVWNIYATNNDAYIALVGNAVRVCSIFNYITPYGEILIFTTPVFLTVFMTKSGYYQYFAVILIGLNVIGAFLTGGRAVVIENLTIIFIAVIFCFFSKHTPFKVKKHTLLFIICTPLLFPILLQYTSPDAINNFKARLENIGSEENSWGNDAEERIGGAFSLSYTQGKSVSFFGNGIGSATNFASFSTLTKQDNISWVEAGKYHADFGWIGTILIYIAKCLCLVPIISAILAIKSKEFYLGSRLIVVPLVFALKAPFEYNIFSFIVVCTTIGLIFAIVNIEQQTSVNGSELQQ